MIALLAAASLVATSGQVVEDVDPIDDRASAYVAFGTETQGFMIGCPDTSNHELRAVARFRDYLGDSQAGLLAGGVLLEFRFDKHEAQTVTWSANVDTVFSNDGAGNPWTFIKRLSGTTSLYLRATHLNGRTVEMGFAYPDPRAAVEQVLARCGFQPDGRWLTKPKKPKR